MPKLTTFILLFVGCFLLLNCKSSNLNTSQNPDIDSVIVENIGKNYVKELNSDGSLLLARQKPGGHIASIVQYIVLNVSTNQVIHSGSYRGGYVKWFGTDSLEISSLSSSDIKQEPVKKVINLSNSDK